MHILAWARAAVILSPPSAMDLKTGQTFQYQEQIGRHRIHWTLTLRSMPSRDTSPV